MNYFDNFIKFPLPPDYTVKDLAQDVAFIKSFGIPQDIHDERIQRLIMFYDLQNIKPGDYKKLIANLQKFIESKIPDQEKFLKAVNDIKNKIAYRNQQKKTEYKIKIKNAVGAVQELPFVPTPAAESSITPPATSAIPAFEPAPQFAKLFPEPAAIIEDKYVLSEAAQKKLAEHGVLIKQTEPVSITSTVGVFHKSPVEPSPSFVIPIEAIHELPTETLQSSAALTSVEAIQELPPEKPTQKKPEAPEKEKFYKERHDRIKEYIEKDQKKGLAQIEL